MKFFKAHEFVQENSWETLPPARCAQLANEKRDFILCQAAASIHNLLKEYILLYNSSALQMGLDKEAKNTEEFKAATEWLNNYRGEE